MDYLVFALSSIAGYSINNVVTKPDSKVNKKLPKIHIKFIQICPCIKIHIGDKYIHLHHWMNFSILLVISITFGIGFLQAMPAKGFLIGGILQGVTYPDWKQIIKKKHVNKKV